MCHATTRDSWASLLRNPRSSGISVSKIPTGVSLLPSGLLGARINALCGHDLDPLDRPASIAVGFVSVAVAIPSVAFHEWQKSSPRFSREQLPIRTGLRKLE